MFSENEDCRQCQQKVRNERRRPRVVLRNTLAEEQRDDVDTGDHGAEERHGRIAGHDQQYASDSAKCTGGHLENRDNEEHRSDRTGQWTSREMMVEVLAISLPIDDLVETRLQKKHGEKCRDQDLHNVECRVWRVDVWHSAIVA